ncbi:MAG: hypothetical protein LBI26_02100 [Holosporales bacterium]|jgi:hypothetical protein|nr:hypothetical protein [Holosporales bacterium]
MKRQLLGKNGEDQRKRRENNNESPNMRGQFLGRNGGGQMKRRENNNESSEGERENIKKELPYPKKFYGKLTLADLNFNKKREK